MTQGWVFSSGGFEIWKEGTETFFIRAPDGTEKNGLSKQQLLDLFICLAKFCSTQSFCPECGQPYGRHHSWCKIMEDV